MDNTRTEPHASTPEADAEGASRRSFLHRSLAVGAAAVPAALLASTPGTSRAGRLLPRLGTPYPTLYPGQNKRFFLEIQYNENNHTPVIQELISSMGGVVRPKPAFKNLNIKSYHDFVMKSTLFENTGAGAYQGAGPFIFNKAVLAAAASIGWVEAFQSGFLNTLYNSAPGADVSFHPTVVPVGGTDLGGAPNNSFAPPLTFEQVFARLMPYLVDPTAVMNAVPLPTTTPSPENDIAIANFALIPEYLEREFYNLNVPLIFG